MEIERRDLIAGAAALAMVGMVTPVGAEERSAMYGYFLPAEGASDRALVLFTFPSLAIMKNIGHCSATIRTSSTRMVSVTRAAA